MILAVLRTGSIFFLSLHFTHAQVIAEKKESKCHEYRKLLVSNHKRCLDMELVKLSHEYLQSPDINTQEAFIEQLLTAPKSEAFVATLSLTEPASVLRQLTHEIPRTFWKELYVQHPSVLSMLNADTLRSFSDLNWIQKQDSKYLAESEIDWAQSLNLFASLPPQLAASLAVKIPALLDLLPREWLNASESWWLIKLSQRWDSNTADFSSTVITDVEKAKDFNSDLLASLLTVIFESEAKIIVWAVKLHKLLAKFCSVDAHHMPFDELNGFTRDILNHATSIAHNRRRISRILATLSSRASFLSSFSSEDRAEIIDALQTLCSAPLSRDIWIAYSISASPSTSLESVPEDDKCEELMHRMLLKLPTKCQDIHSFIAILLRALFAENPEDWSGESADWDGRFKAFWSGPSNAHKVTGTMLMLAWSKLARHMPREFCRGRIVFRFLLSAYRRMHSGEQLSSQDLVAAQFRLFNSDMILSGSSNLISEFPLMCDLLWCSRNAAIQLNMGLLEEALPLLNRLHTLLSRSLPDEIVQWIHDNTDLVVVKLALELPQLLVELSLGRDLVEDVEATEASCLQTLPSEDMTQTAIPHFDEASNSNVPPICTKDVEIQESHIIGARDEQKEEQTATSLEDTSNSADIESTSPSSKKKKGKKKNKKKSEVTTSAESIKATFLEKIIGFKEEALSFIENVEEDFRQSCIDSYYNISHLSDRIDLAHVTCALAAFAAQKPVRLELIIPSSLSKDAWAIFIAHPILDEIPSWNLDRWMDNFNLQSFISHTDYAFIKAEDARNLVSCKPNIRFDNLPDFWATASPKVINVSFGFDEVRLLPQQSLSAFGRNPAASSFPELFPWTLRDETLLHASPSELIKRLREVGLTTENLASVLAFILHSEEFIRSILVLIASCFTMADSGFPVLERALELESKQFRLVVIQRKLLSKTLHIMQKEGLERNQSPEELACLEKLACLAMLPLNSTVRMSYLRRGVGYIDKAQKMLLPCSPDLKAKICSNMEFFILCVAWRIAFDEEGSSVPLKIPDTASLSSPDNDAILNTLSKMANIELHYDPSLANTSRWNAASILDDLWMPLTDVIKSSNIPAASFLEESLTTRFLVHQMFGVEDNSISDRAKMGLCLARRMELTKHFDSISHGKLEIYSRSLLTYYASFSSEERLKLTAFVDDSRNAVHESCTLWKKRSLLTHVDLADIKAPLEEAAEIFRIAWGYCRCTSHSRSSALGDFAALFISRRKLSNMLSILGSNLSEEEIALFNELSSLRAALNLDASILTKDQQHSLLTSSIGREFLCSAQEIFSTMLHYEAIDTEMAADLNVPLATIGIGLATMRNDVFAIALKAFRRPNLYNMYWRNSNIVIEKLKTVPFQEWAHQISFWWYIVSPEKIGQRYYQSFRSARALHCSKNEEALQTRFMYSIMQELNFLWFYVLMRTPKLSASTELTKRIKDAAKEIASFEGQSAAEDQKHLPHVSLAEQSQAFLSPQSILRQAIVRGIAEEDCSFNWIKTYVPGHFKVAEFRSFDELHSIVRSAFSGRDDSWIARFLLVNLLDHSGTRLNPEIKAGDLMFTAFHLSEIDRVLFMWILDSLGINLEDYCNTDWNCRDPISAPETNALLRSVKVSRKRLQI